MLIKIWGKKTEALQGKQTQICNWILLPESRALLWALQEDVKHKWDMGISSLCWLLMTCVL